MSVPLILSEVPNATPYVQYIATNGQTVFDYTFPITQDSDLVVVVNGVTLPTDQGYTLAGQGNDTGGTLTFTLGQSTGTIVTLYRDIEIERITQIAQNSGFSSATFNAEFNNIYLIMQQLEASIAQCLQLPNTNTPAPTTTLTPARYAGNLVGLDSNGNPTPVALLTNALTQTIFNTFLAGAVSFALTPQEIAAGTVPTNLGYMPAPFMDARRYGWSSTNTAAQNATALSNAILALDATPGSIGGTVALPGGSYALNPVTIPAGVAVRGAGKRATYITHTDSGSADILFTLGGTGSASYGCALSDLAVLYTGLQGTIALIQATVGAEISRCYFEGETISAGRSTRGVVIDAASVSTAGFYNVVREVECNHLHNAFWVFSSGNTQPTQQYLIGCSATGDVATDTTSVGFQFGTGADVSPAGQATVLQGCDTEACAKGYYHTATAGPVEHLESRGEGNTADFVFDAGALGATIVGGIYANITDNSGDFRHQYFGLRNGSNVVFNRTGPTTVGGNATTDKLLQLVLAGSATGDALEVQNSSNAVLAKITSAGLILGAGLTSSAATPTGAAGTVSFGTTTATSATAGANGDVPAQVVGYLEIDLAGTKYKIPYYAV